jgi:hypothetical protein
VSEIDWQQAHNASYPLPKGSNAQIAVPEITPVIAIPLPIVFGLSQ